VILAGSKGKEKKKPALTLKERDAEELGKKKKKGNHRGFAVTARQRKRKNDFKPLTFPPGQKKKRGGNRHPPAGGGGGAPLHPL